MKPTLLVSLSILAMAAPAAHAAIVAPYTGTDGNTLHLWQFDEADDTATTTSATTGGVALDKGNGATLGNASFSGFGNAGDTSAGGNADFLSSSQFNVSTVTGTGGAFTFEAMINISETTSLQQIFSMDQNTQADRPFQFRVFQDNLEFVKIAGGVVSNSATIPTAGADAFVANEWFHVAVTYNGTENTADNLSLYWTRVDASRTEANLISSFLLDEDLSGEAVYGVGNDGRGVGGQDKNLEGLIDEVRISGIARPSDDMLFAIPEPSTALLAGLGLRALLRRRR